MKGLILVTIFLIFNLTDGLPTLEHHEVILPQIKKLSFGREEIVSETNSKDILMVLNKLNQTEVQLKGILNIEINAVLDEILKNLKDVLIHNGMDPFELRNNSFKLFPLGRIELTSGWLQDISTINRDGDVVVSYHTSTKKLTFLLPLNFKVILFTYKYHVKVALLGIKGDLQGKIDNIKLHLAITYDPKNLTFSLNELSMRNSGKITVKFAGNGLVDWITNAMTSMVTTVLHPILIRVVQLFVRSAGSDLIDVVNDYIHEGLQH